MKIHKINLVVGAVLIFGLSLVGVLASTRLALANPTAIFTATDEATVGNGQSWYPSNLGSGLANVSSDVTEIIYYLNGNEVGTNTKTTGFTGFSMNATGLSNGTYHLSATAYNALGQTATVMATDGNSYLTFNVNNAPNAKFTATDEGVFGNGPGAVSGTTFTTQLADESSGIVQIAYYLNGVLSAVNTKVDGVDGYRVDASTLSNGVYHLTATVQGSDGDIGNVTAEDGNDNLTFTVVNAAPATSSQTCTDQQQDLNTITTRIVNRTESQIQTIDSVAKAVEQYYSKQPKKLADYAQTVNELTSNENQVQSDAINMVNDSVINCSQDLSSQVVTFKSSVSQLDNDINNYIGNVQQLISKLESL